MHVIMCEGFGTEWGADLKIGAMPSIMLWARQYAFAW
jgi:hypothetical protein